MQPIYLTIALAPLVAAVIAGLFGKTIGKAGAHGITILGVGVSCVLSFYVLYQIVFEGSAPFNGTVYTWLVSDGVHSEANRGEREVVRDKAAPAGSAEFDGRGVHCCVLYLGRHRT